ncbi:MAG: glycosyltransferase [Microgenomates group bacterium]
MRKVAIILPTYNEAGNIEKLIPQIFEEIKDPGLAKNWEIHLVVVDSQSSDGTAKIVSDLIKKYPRIHLLETKKEGLGRAYLEGFKFALDNINPYLFFEMDADLSHQPKEIPIFIKKIEKGADFVIGSRYTKGGSIPKDWEIHRKLFSIIGNLIIRLGFMKLSITDWTSGYRAFKSWIVKNAINHIKNYSGYVFQVAFLDFALKNDANIVETPIQFKERRWGISKINAFQYIFQTIIYVFLNSSFIKFVIVGLIGFVVDFGISYLGIQKLHQSVFLTTIISTETAIISNFLLNNFWSFSHKKIKGLSGHFFAGFFKFNLVSSGSIIIQSAGMQILTNIFGRKFWYLFKILIITFIIIPYSYILYNKIIWKGKK